MPVTFDDLPLDVLISIAGHLEPFDVLSLRQTSHTLRGVTYERSVWAQLYASSSLPRPFGPHPLQSRQALEETMTRTSMVDRKMVSSMKPKATRRLSLDTDAEPEDGFCLLKGRWLIMSTREIVAFQDLDAADFDGSYMTIYEVEEGWSLDKCDTVETVGGDGQYYGYLGFLQTQEESGQREIRVFKVSGTSHNIAFTEVFRQTLQSHGSQLHRPFIMAIGPSSVIVMWTVTDRERRYVIMELESSWKEPLIQPLEDIREGPPTIIVAQPILTSSHLIILGSRLLCEPSRITFDIGGWISAIPLSIAIAGIPAPSRRFSGSFDFTLLSPFLLRDSVHTSGDSTDASPHGRIGNCGGTRIAIRCSASDPVRRCPLRHANICGFDSRCARGTSTRDAREQL